jgi:hypothetical protein
MPLSRARENRIYAKVLAVGAAMRIASYSVENLFERARAMNLDTWANGKEVLKTHAEMNRRRRPRADSGLRAASRRRPRCLLHLDLYSLGSVIAAVGEAVVGAQCR